jgi:DNA polymerase III subunit gamma/tau
MISLIKKYSIKKLSDIIGQEINISFLQNSLFRNIFYPLYLFSGMRGTGKTSSARLFAASLLCEYLSHFQNNPKIQIPCYECDSCLLYQKNQHPDIIELDAASNSGIETIRSIIENAFILPVMSKKKIYIIDEVHMLSKAAFNACLKIMEEPPAHVHFILATTEIHKVLDTIKSRAIVLHYKPIKTDIIAQYIKKISDEEKINLQDNAAHLIARIGEGSVRDSLNILNRLILINNTIDQNMVLEEYGLSDSQSIYDFIQAILDQDTETYYAKKKYITLNNHNKISFFAHTSEYLQTYIQKNIEEKNIKKSQFGYQILERLYHYEEIFFSSLSPIGIFDLLIAPEKNTVEYEKNDKTNAYVTHESGFDQNKTINHAPEKKMSVPENQNKNKANEEKLLLFINSLEKIIKTIFLQGRISIHYESKKIIASFQKNFYFYKDFLETKKPIILEEVKKVWGNDFYLTYDFEGSSNTKEQIDTNELKKTISPKPSFSVSPEKKTTHPIPQSTLVNRIQDILPGETTLLKENDNE